MSKKSIPISSADLQKTAKKLKDVDPSETKSTAKLDDDDAKSLESLG